jgi:tetratricopeptide (TPR) repeat protein
LAERNYAINELGYACKGIPDKDWEAMTNDEQLVYCYHCKLSCSYGNELILKDDRQKKNKTSEENQNLYDKELRKGHELMMDLKFEQALEIFDLVLKKDPANIIAWYDKVSALHNLKKFEDELRCYDKIMEIEPSEAVWYNKSVALNSLGRHEEAIECFKEVLKIVPDDNEALLNQGIAFHNLGMFQEALECYIQLTNINPEHKEGWYRRGMTTGALGNYKEALKFHDKALELDPDYEDALFAKGMDLELLQQPNKAIVYYDKTLKLYPLYVHAWYRKGIALISLGKYNDALKCMETILEIEPTFEDAKVQISRLNRLINNGPKIQKRPSFSNPEEIIRSCELALKKNPKDKIEWLVKGKAFIDIKRYEEALNCFNNALEIDPLFKEAKIQKQLIENDTLNGAQMIPLDLSRIEETEDGLIYEDEKRKLWKLLFDGDDKRNKV